MKLNNILLAASILVGAATACTDTWDDHYAVQTNGEGSMWEAISNNESLSNFKAVLEATGYDTQLKTSQVFTVFAPTNDGLSAKQAEDLIEQYKKEKTMGVKDNKNSVVKEFVQNHISLYNYSVSSQMPDTTINMMNGKRVSYTKSGYSGKDYLSKNAITSNGILYTIGQTAEYVPNVYEYLSKDSRLTGMWSYLNEYNLEEFLSDKSVPGEIIDGKTHYLDSVTVTVNEIVQDKKWLKSEIFDEDSTYWMLVPSNNVWNTLVDENEKYFQYDKQVIERDSFMHHYPRFNALAGTIFSKTRNPRIFESGTAGANDSIMSTNAAYYNQRRTTYGSYDKKYFQYDDPFGAQGVLAGVDKKECSNGVVMVADKWNIKRRQTFLQDIIMEGESSSTIDTLNVTTDSKKGDTQPANYVNVTSDNPFYGKVSGNGYLELQPIGTVNFSKALFDIRGVLSNVPYDVYVVTAPAEAGDTLATETQRLPTSFRCTLQCHDMDGVAQYIGVKGDMLSVYKNNQVSQGPTTNYTNSKVAVDRLVNEAGKVDSVYVGTFTFPTCSYNTSEAQVKMIIDSRVSNTQVNNGTYNRILRLDCIVFKPHEDE